MVVLRDRATLARGPYLYESTRATHSQMQLGLLNTSRPYIGTRFRTSWTVTIANHRVHYSDKARSWYFCGLYSAKVCFLLACHVGDASFSCDNYIEFDIVLLLLGIAAQPRDTSREPVYKPVPKGIRGFICRPRPDTM